MIEKLVAIMSVADWLKLLLPIAISALVTLFGLGCTFHKLKKEFQNSLKRANIEDKKHIYCKALHVMEELGDNLTLVYKTDYINKLKECKSELDLMGTKKIVSLYTKFIFYVNKIYINYQMLYEDTYPSKGNKKTIGENGVPRIITFEERLKEFEMQMSIYRYEHMPTKSEIVADIVEIIEEMRKDIGMDK